MSEIQCLPPASPHPVQSPCRAKQTLWGAYAPSVIKTNGELDHDNSSLETSCRRDYLAKTVSYLAVLASLPTPGTVSSPKSLPTTNATKSFKGGSLRSNPVWFLTVCYRLVHLWSFGPLYQKLVDDGCRIKQREREGAKKTKRGLALSEQKAAIPDAGGPESKLFRGQTAAPLQGQHRVQRSCPLSLSMRPR